MKTASMRASTLRLFLTALSLAVGLVLLAALATAYAGIPLHQTPHLIRTASTWWSTWAMEMS